MLDRSDSNRPRRQRRRTALAAAAMFALLTACDLLGFGEEETDGDPLQPLPANTTVTDSSGNTYEVGYVQVSGVNQDPRVTKTDASGTQLWQVRHDETPADARAEFVALDSAGRPFVAFTVDGGSNDATRFQAHRVEAGAFGDAPFPSYGPGGGKKVTIIARLDPATGDIERATFLRARLSSGNTNTIRPTGLAVSGSTVIIDVASAAWPPAAGATASNWIRFDETRFNDTTRPQLRYSLPADLTSIEAVTVLPDPD